jgi:SAM-dependent methyltransferase
MSIHPALLTVLADPSDKTPLRWDGEHLRSESSARQWRVREGIPELVEEGLARYEGVSTWYDEAMRGNGGRSALGGAGYALLAEMIGRGEGLAVDLGCGTGLSAEYVRGQGYQPVGVDLSFDMLLHARSRLPVAQGDAARLPLKAAVTSLAYSTFTTTDWDDLNGALAEAYRILKPGGRYVCVAVHPCFAGSHAEAQPSGDVVQHPGYVVSRYHAPEEHKTPVRSRVGAWHRTLADLVNAFIDAGFTLRLMREGGAAALPEALAIAAQKPLLA